MFEDEDEDKPEEEEEEKDQAFIKLLILPFKT